MTKKYHMINWIDGMKIRKRHFVDQQHAFNQRVMDGISTHLSAINYGLLSPSFQDSTPAFKLDIKIENTNTVHVNVFSCKAVTPGGFIIDIDNENGHTHHYSVNVPEAVIQTEKEQRHMIILSANPYKGEETGEPDPEEVPPRRPYVQPTYQLGLLPRNPAVGDSLNNYGSFNLTIGEVIVDSSNIRLNENYIPPCMAVCSSPVLMDVYSRWGESLRKLESLCMRINRKIVSRQQEYMLAEMIHQLSRDIRSYFGMRLYRFNGSLRYAPPIDLIENLAGLARLLKNSIEMYRGAGKEELINYFVEWCDLNQGQFEKVIGKVVDLVYDHAAISEAVGYCTRFLGEITDLYSKLDELEYIGRKSGKDIFVKEEQHKPGPKKRNVNFLVQ